ncbi:MAG TPA: helix-turn-helix domain-containing protein [Acidisoma sp.]|jgi:CRP/FNR family nitrogen fixation transcriptional regulator|uniref:helix-turn-helix domain-containing protein n=1 Tax=Acidisoma sp. TaxID=1872115 RepID=UPI002CED1113|nr:helix-turn-helix domain-containing protein [Acidisoma sp.]HTI03377.1 helix-turn-helix domain-containing protein [Acidisoma sp.]
MFASPFIFANKIEAAPGKNFGLPVLAAASAAIDGFRIGPASAALGHVENTGALVDIEKGCDIIAQGDAAEYCFEVVEGCVRSVQRLEDGRRQVSDFLMPGDVFGLDAVGEHEFAAEAVTAVTIRRLRLSTVELLAEEDAAFGQRLRRHLTRQAKAMRSRIVLLGRMTAAERIAAFLLEMTERLEGSRQGIVELPMSRGDMADYLGLTIETVSRCLSDLKRCGVISVKGAHIAIHNRRALTAETLH